MTKTIGFIGVSIIVILSIFYVRDRFNYDPLFMGETKEVVAHVTENKLSDRGKGVVHEIKYEYIFDGRTYSNSYFSNKGISRLSAGDSLIISVSISSPSKNKVLRYFESN